MADLRLFTAVSLPPSAEEQIDLVLTKASRYQEIKWTARHQLHMTLCFIGAVDEKSVPALEERLNRISTSCEPFEIEIKGLDGFPNLKRPKVLFVPIAGGQAYFTKLSRLISGQIQAPGKGGGERDVRAHVTLGRVRDGQDVSQAIRALRESGLALGMEWKVDRFSLFQSQLTPQGALHTRLKEFELRG
jgi:2'-5' RNA ligase